MKRAREEESELASLTMANCLMLLSRGVGGSGGAGGFESAADFPSRVFECKTCNRQFPSFQALGGHRASHKKPRPTAAGEGDGLDLELRSSPPAAPPKPKTHECSICGVEFAIGQALGGHMRRHRSAPPSEPAKAVPPLLTLLPAAAAAATAKVVKRTNSSRRILCLDLNLAPPENDFEFPKLAPVRG